MLKIAAIAAGTDVLTFRGRLADPFAAPERITVAEAFQRFAGIDLLATVDDNRGHAAALAEAAERAGIRIAGDDTWSDVFSRVLLERIEPCLDSGRATILCEYPACSAALARPSPSDARVAERFELYACGVELANAFGEQTDPAEQRRRLEAEMAEKERLYGERYPIDEDFLDGSRAHAAGQRRGAGVRPAGHAGDRRRQHRAGAVDADGRARHLMTSPADRIIDLYQRRAREYDEARGRSLFERGWLDRFTALLPAGGAVLDIGCGCGEPIARHLIASGFAVTGVDAAPAMIELCRARLPIRHVAGGRHAHAGAGAQLRWAASPGTASSTCVPRISGRCFPYSGRTPLPTLR